jgi:hypothetical protein
MLRRNPESFTGRFEDGKFLPEKGKDSSENIGGTAAQRVGPL